jgi:hypothetical protein
VAIFLASRCGFRTELLRKRIKNAEKEKEEPCEASEIRRN